MDNTLEVEKLNLKKQLYNHLKELQLEFARQVGHSNYAVEEPLQQEIDKMWVEINKLELNK